MQEKIDDKRKKLLIRAIDEILWFSWDPIGINLNYGCRSEYSGYVHRVFDRLMSDGDRHSIAQLLGTIAGDDMGCISTKTTYEFGQDAAKLIIGAYRDILAWSDKYVDSLTEKNGYVEEWEAFKANSL